MFGSSATYPRRSAGLLARPRLGPFRSYLRPRNYGAAPDVARLKKSKLRKPNGAHKMDHIKKRTPDYTDIAYREAVSRLRYLLAESYSPYASTNKLHQVHISKVEESGDETEGSVVASERSRPVTYRPSIYTPKRPFYSDSLPKLSHRHSTLNVPSAVERETALPPARSVEPQPPLELMAFIDRQDEYIGHLEKETQYCRDELSNLLGKVKDIISENESLHEKEKAGLLKSVFDYFESGDDENQNIEESGKSLKRKPIKLKAKRLEGPLIIFESRISELEAQLTQTKIDLKKALEEADSYKKKLNDWGPSSVEGLSSSSDHGVRQQVETLQREKNELNDNLIKLQAALSQFRDKEADASHKVKRSLDVVDQAQFEKAQCEMEVRRLKDELDRQHDRLRELLHEQGRKLAEERSQAERRHTQQMEQLSAELAGQWDVAGKLQLDLEKQRRVEADLRRELVQKNVTIEDLKKELQTKIAGLQSEVMQAGAEKGSLEQELNSSRLNIERSEREGRQEISRLEAEVAALRQRLDRADADLLHSRRENIRLTEQLASMEREVNLNKILHDSQNKGTSDGETSNSTNKSAQREKELTKMIQDMEGKHVQTVAELEGMILSQNAVMDKLKDQCHALTQRLEDSSARHKEEMVGLQSNIDYLNSKFDASYEAQQWKDDAYGSELQQHDPNMESNYDGGDVEPRPDTEPESEPRSSALYEPEPQPTALYEPEPQRTALYEPEPQSEPQRTDLYEPEPQSEPQHGDLYEPEPQPTALYETEPSQPQSEERTPTDSGRSGH